jgi:hypothetical protein
MSTARKDRRWWRNVVLVACLALAGGTLSSARGQSARGQDLDKLPLRLVAFAVNLGTTPDLRPPRVSSQIVEITINRWSTDQEREELLVALAQHGETALLKALQENPPVGTIRTPDTLAWDLHYARLRILPDGSRRISLATDRPISFWEAAHLPRSIHYPFTLVEIHLGPNGHGDGKMSVATKIELSSDKHEIELENYATQPVRLLDVHVEKH